MAKDMVHTCTRTQRLLQKPMPGGLGKLLLPPLQVRWERHRPPVVVRPRLAEDEMLGLHWHPFRVPSPPRGMSLLTPWPLPCLFAPLLLLVCILCLALEARAYMNRCPRNIVNALRRRDRLQAPRLAKPADLNAPLQLPDGRAYFVGACG